MSGRGWCVFGQAVRAGSAGRQCILCCIASLLHVLLLSANCASIMHAWTLLLECSKYGLHLRCQSPAPLYTEYDEGGRYALLIEDAHATASSAAMELLRRGENLADGLAVLKRYFLAAQVRALPVERDGLLPACGGEGSMGEDRHALEQ